MIQWALWLRVSGHSRVRAGITGPKALHPSPISTFNPEPEDLLGGALLFGRLKFTFLNGLSGVRFGV